jgi:hypothetical protein
MVVVLDPVHIVLPRWNEQLILRRRAGNRILRRVAPVHECPAMFFIRSRDPIRALQLNLRTWYREDCQLIGLDLHSVSEQQRPFLVRLVLDPVQVVFSRRQPRRFERLILALTKNCRGPIISGHDIPRLRLGKSLGDLELQSRLKHDLRRFTLLIHQQSPSRERADGHRK